MLKWSKAEQEMSCRCLHGCCSITTVDLFFFKLTLCVSVLTSQIIFFFFFFCPRLQAKAKERRYSSLLDMKYQLFISQACHINTGSILGWDTKRRNKNSVETKKKNVGIGHRGEKGREVQPLLAKLSLHGDAVTPLTYTGSVFMSVLTHWV